MSTGPKLDALRAIEGVEGVTEYEDGEIGWRPTTPEAKAAAERVLTAYVVRGNLVCDDDDGDPPCINCGLRAGGPGQPDPCLGWLPNVVYACCGHGYTDDAYVWLKHGDDILRGTDALAYATKLQTCHEE